jgi:hypothetical protein
LGWQKFSKVGSMVIFRSKLSSKQTFENGYLPADIGHISQEPSQSDQSESAQNCRDFSIVSATAVLYSIHSSGPTFEKFQPINLEPPTSFHGVLQCVAV